MILEKVPVKLRGELSRWMIEPRTGVFVGRMSALVRDRLWTMVCESCEKTKVQDPDKRPGALMVYGARTEQGFTFRKYGDPSREVLDLEGLSLVRVPYLYDPAWKTAKKPDKPPGTGAVEDDSAPAPVATAVPEEGPPLPEGTGSAGEETDT